MLLDILLVPVVHGVLRPHCEWFSYYTVEDVDGPLPWYAVTILVVGEVLFHLRVMLESGEDVLEGQALVLRAE